MWKQTVLFGAALTTVSAMADIRYVDAPVTHVEAIIERVAYTEPEEHCWFEEVDVRPRGRAESSATTPLIGALIGGAIGNAVGHKKRNKQVGAVVGALIGGSIAADMSRQHSRTHTSTTRRVRQEVCEVVSETKYRREVTGYLVTYEFGGESYQTRLDRKPGDTVRLRISVRPA